MPAAEPLPELSAAGLTDAAGGFGAQFAIDPERWYLARLDYEATVADLAGRRFATRGTDLSAFRDRFVGVSLATELANHESLAVQAVVVTADGTALRDIPLEVEIAYGAAQTLRPQPQGWKVVRACSLRSAATPVSCPVTPPASGYYRVTGSVRDSQGREHRSQIQRFVGVGAASPWNRRDPGVTLSTTHTANVGDSVAVELTSELEPATALISVLTDRVLESRVQRLHKGRNLLQVKVSPAMAPSFRVHAVVQTPRLGHLSAEQLRLIGRDTLQPLRHEAEQTVQVHEPAPDPSWR
ncbi:MAG: hypothetical protein HC872_01005 [Gammaproteobacteria bacterium]|nr:hypothetical protein [Gammaproteobacteria bacterium]